MRKLTYVLALLLTIAGMLLVLAPPLHGQTSSTSLGIWRGTLVGIPSVTLTLADDTGSVDGTIVFYGLDGDTHQVASIEPHTLIHPTLAGNALTFQVRRLDATLITVKIIFTTPTKAELHCLDCGDDAPITPLIKDTL